jgi:hypothetical protein
MDTLHSFDILRVMRRRRMSANSFKKLRCRFRSFGDVCEQFLEKGPTAYQNEHETLSVFPQHFFVSAETRIAISAAQ